MLVLARREAESIVLCLPDGEFIAISVIAIHNHEKGGKARLGITAPRSVRVLRNEILEAAGVDYQPPLTEKAKVAKPRECVRECVPTAPAPRFIGINESL